MKLAPNGKPSNLTPEQYRLVRTPAFKNWFGDWESSPENASKVIDENGEPLVVYHGTDEEFTVFDVNAKSKWLNQKKIEASFFSETERGALSYLSDISKYLRNKEGGKILKCFLKVINPIVADAKVLEPSEWYQADEKEGYVYSIQYVKENVIEEAKRKGNDGVIFLNAWDNVPIGKIVTAFEPNQIKLADGTNTTFDANNPDIRYADGGIIIPKGAEGDCYKNVQDYLLDNDLPNAVIVHGEVTNGSGKVIGHAWIINGVDVIDPTTGVITTKEKYERLNPKEEARYSFSDAMKMRFKTKNYGFKLLSVF